MRILAGQIDIFNTIGEDVAVLGHDGSGHGLLILRNSAESERVLIEADNSPRLAGNASYPIALQNVTGRFTLQDTQVYNAAAPVAWTDLNLSAYVGSRSALVLLMVENDGVGSNNYRFRRNGTAYEQDPQADNYPGVFSCRCDDVQEQNWCWALTDASGRVEWCAVANNTTKVRLVAFIG